MNRKLLISAISNLSTAYNLVIINVSHVTIAYQYCGGADACSAQVEAASTAVLVGAILGQLTFGYIGDCVGRSAALRLTMALSLFGATISAAAVPLGGDSSSVLTFLALSRFVLGVGVGGVYPLSATIATECVHRPHPAASSCRLHRAEAEAAAESRKPRTRALSDPSRYDPRQDHTHTAVDAQAHTTALRHAAVETTRLFAERTRTSAGRSSSNAERGRNASLVFSMQGVANLAAPLVSWALLAVFGVPATGSGGADPGLAWRLALALGALPGLLLVPCMGEGRGGQGGGARHTADERMSAPIAALRAEAGRPAGPSSTLLSTLRQRKYWSKLLGTAGGWFLFDITFYGNSLFQPTVLSSVFHVDQAAHLGASRRISAHLGSPRPDPALSRRRPATRRRCRATSRTTSARRWRWWRRLASPATTSPSG